MKKFLTLILVCLITCCCFIFAGCAPSGTYKFKCLKYEDSNNSITCNVGDKYNGVTLTKDSFILIFNDDNTGVFRTELTYENAKTKKEVAIGEWMQGYKDEIYLTYNNQTYTATKDGNTIIMEISNGVYVTFTK